MKKTTTMVMMRIICAVLMVLANSAGASVTISSNAIQMNVQDMPPAITSQPASVNVFEAEAVNLSVAATGGGLSWQWCKSSTDNPVSGGTSSALTISNALAVNSGNYFCIVTNSGGSVTSSVAIVNVYTQSVITITVVPPDTSGALIVATGSGAVYTAVITAAGTNPMLPSAVTLQWKKGGVDVATDVGHIDLGTTGAWAGDKLILTGLQNPGDTGLYTCTATCTAPAPAPPSEGEGEGE